jgi:hypothetical protein
MLRNHIIYLVAHDTFPRLPHTSGCPEPSGEDAEEHDGNDCPSVVPPIVGHPAPKKQDILDACRAVDAMSMCIVRTHGSLLSLAALQDHKRSHSDFLEAFDVRELKLSSTFLGNVGYGQV